MSLKVIEEAIEGGDILLTALAAGIAAATAKKIHSIYKKKKREKDYNLTPKETDNDYKPSRDMELRDNILNVSDIATQELRSKV